MCVSPNALRTVCVCVWLNFNYFQCWTSFKVNFNMSERDINIFHSQKLVSIVIHKYLSLVLSSSVFFFSMPHKFATKIAQWAENDSRSHSVWVNKTLCNSAQSVFFILNSLEYSVALALNTYWTTRKKNQFLSLENLWSNPEPVCHEDTEDFVERKKKSTRSQTLKIQYRWWTQNFCVCLFVSLSWKPLWVSLALLSLVL